MSRKLEKFISDNRNEFDDAIPSAKVWEKLEAGFEQKKPRKFILPVLQKWSIAAAVLITAGIAGFILLNSKNAAVNTPPMAVIDSPADINKLAPDYAPEVNQFARLIALKQQELKAMAPEQPALYRKFSGDINQLDSSYKSLKSQLSINPNKEMLLEAMIQNLQLQLNVLNQQLNIINQIKQSKKENHEKIDQTI